MNTLSPSNTGNGFGVARPTSVLNSSNLDNLSNAVFGKSALNFQGKGFNTTIPSSGGLFLSVELEGPAGLAPDICWGSRTTPNTPIAGIVCATSSYTAPLAGPGVIVNETISNAGYVRSFPLRISPSTNVYFSVDFGSANSAYINSVIAVHFGGTSSNSTSYTRIGP